MAGRFLEMFRPLSRFMPEVKPPERRVGFNEKIFWTALALALYLVMSEVPLYGIGLGGEDPFLYLRVIFASHRGSLMELGIGPIVTAGLILQLLAGSGMVSCDFTNPSDRALFTAASKVFSIIFITFQASAYIIGGVFGEAVKDPRIGIIVFIQLIIAGVILMLLDELIQKGWGIGSGISLFILAGVAQNIVWASIAPTPPVGDGKSFGALVALAQTALGGESLWKALVREGALPSILGFLTTLTVFLIVIYFEGVRVEIPRAYAGYRGFRGRYPIKLLYVSNLPVIFAAALFANVYFFSQLLWSNYNQSNKSFWLNLLGKYQWVTEGEQRRLEPIGGLVYYVISPQSISEVGQDPSRALIFVVIMVAFCIVFSITWLEVGGLGPRTVAKQLVDSGMQIPGFRRSERPVELLLKRYIPVVAILGGIIVGLIASVADFFGVFGSGMGVLLSVGILYQYYQLLMQERVAEMYPALRHVLGG